jgi:hypothetical protein
MDGFLMRTRIAVRPLLEFLLLTTAYFRVFHVLVHRLSFPAAADCRRNAKFAMSRKWLLCRQLKAGWENRQSQACGHINHAGDGRGFWLILTALIVNLALAFARHGFRAGILDTDIFGPSIPTLLNLSGEPRLDDSM